MYSYKLYVHIVCTPKSPPPAPDPPSGLTVSQNGLNSVLVSWIGLSRGADVTGYTIYYQQEGGERFSVCAGISDITATISGLIEGATYSFTIVATSNTLHVQYCHWPTDHHHRYTLCALDCTMRTSNTTCVVSIGVWLWY